MPVNNIFQSVYCLKSLDGAVPLSDAISTTHERGDVSRLYTEGAAETRTTSGRWRRVGDVVEDGGSSLE